VKEPGERIASGRDSDIFDYGPGLVLRRSRHGYSMANEARTMEYVRAHGYPVPAVAEISADGTDLVMERIDGPSMVADLSRRPWTLRQQGDVLADLHRRLHEIAAPPWLAAAPGNDGDRLLHLDLHPLNIIVAAKGPVVIDWPNAARGDWAIDVALTWILIAAGEVPTGHVWAAVLERFRARFVNGFLRHFDRAELIARLRTVVEWKVTDPNMSESEQRAMWRIAAGAEA
jgi:aminoglycoside phosphotransferase (APT) family kinase protein